MNGRLDFLARLDPATLDEDQEADDRGRGIFGSAAHRELVYSILLDEIDCGPFDGGCLVFAHALQQLHGGEVFVIEGRWKGLGHRHPPAAQHAFLRCPDGTGLDAAGGSAIEDIGQRFLRIEGLEETLEVTGVRPYAIGDLPDAAQAESPEFLDRLTTALRQAPPGTLKNRRP